MLKRHEVEILLKAGHAKIEVARLAGVSLCSVKRIAQESPVLHVDDMAERAKRQIGRPSTVTNFRKQVVGILQEEPDLATLEILARTGQVCLTDCGYLSCDSRRLHSSFDDGETRDRAREAGPVRLWTGRHATVSIR